MTLNLPRGRGGEETMASAEWADKRYIAAQECLVSAKSVQGFDGKGVVFLGQAEQTGRYLGLTDDRHCLTVAGSRAGKGTALIIPNLILYGGSVVCIDPKGENAHKTAARRRAMGQDVYVLDPFGVSKDAEPASYNPFDDLDAASETVIDDAALLADSFILDRNMKDPHWDDSARDLIKGLILYIKLEMPFPDQHNLVTLRETLTDPAKLDRALVSMSKVTTLGGVIASAATTFAIKPDKERDSVLSTALRHTEFLDSPGMRRVLCGNKNLKPLASLASLRPSRSFSAFRLAGCRPMRAGCA